MCVIIILTSWGNLFSQIDLNLVNFEAIFKQTNGFKNYLHLFYFIYFFFVKIKNSDFEHIRSFERIEEYEHCKRGKRIVKIRLFFLFFKFRIYAEEMLAVHTGKQNKMKLLRPPHYVNGIYHIFFGIY